MGHHHHNINRRTFLGQASCAAVGMTTLFSTMVNLKAMNAASSFNLPYVAGPFDEYKSLVCLMFSGGCDSFHMLLPTTPGEHAAYTTTRSNQALPLDQITDINALQTGGKTYGVHPSLPNVANMFDNGNLAFVSNIGSLIEPTTKQGVYDGTDQLPLGLFSHADQIMHWQTGVPHDRVATGWGGKIADMLNSASMPPNSNTNISMNVSISGTNVYQTGSSTNNFSMGPDGPAGLYGYGEEWLSSQLRTEQVDNMIDAQYQDIFKKTYAQTMKVGRDANAQITEALENATALNTDFGTSYLERQFEMVANMINVRNELGMKRQIFFIDYGGWDHHDELINNSAMMFNEVDNALNSFNNAMIEMGLHNQVTTFGISEFSRTLLSNGNGTDHAWGGNVFVMGGAVNGQRIYGEYPELSLNTNLEIGNGVLVPTTSADEYFAELAMWYNVPQSGLLDIFPNLGNFYSVSSGANPIGFMNI